MMNRPMPPPKPPLEPLTSERNRTWRAGLSTRLLILTILFVLIAEVLIYLPSVANFRNNWLSERLSQARAAALILEKTPPDALPKPLVDELLLGMETTMIALRIDNSRRLLAISDMPPMVDIEADLRQRNYLMEIMTSFETLFFGGHRTMRVVGPPPRGGDFVEIVINESHLREAMIRFSWNILQVSLVISLITALLLFGALNGLIVKPVKKLASAVSRFRTNPEDARSLHQPDGRTDELGTLERNVADMQRALQQELRQREHLANLGLAVAKINHDLRNMLASAQLLADRLGGIKDPNVQRFVPKLLEALDRAIRFCQSTLAYGKAQEKPPELTPVHLLALVDDIREQWMLSTQDHPKVNLAVPEGLAVLADSEHLHRIITNLFRNSQAAFHAPATARNDMLEIGIHAQNIGDHVEIDISDNGPGVPDSVKNRLFQAFSGSSRAGGTGLGLAIAQELMRGMGGTITLIDDPDVPEDASSGGTGTTFRLILPKA
jgi:signal transduction histidine kinase